MKRILLVSPLRGSDFAREGTPWTEGDLQLPRALMPPIDLATIKALTPADIEVDIWDESIRGPVTDETDFGKDYDLLGATGYMTHIPWAQEFARMAHRRGKPAVIGGPGVSGAPDRCRGLFDVVFIGEAELTWPQFLQDWMRGKFRSEYRQVQRPEVDASPLPCWDDFPDMAKEYLVGPVQTTRGCPFDCEFCDVIHLFGRQSRHKPVEHVINEVTALQKLRMRRIFFCDDNFIGEPRYARELLPPLIEANNAFERPLNFGTQLTINLAREEDLMKMMADCRFGPVCIGVESPRQESLREANKPQNFKTDIVSDIKKIQSYGISVRASMIVGFDHDDDAIFDETFEFLQAAGIANPSVSMLKAYPGTPLLARLLRDGRVIDIDDNHYRGAHLAITNIIPKQMTRVELMRGTARLLERIHDWDNFEARVTTMIDSVKYRPELPRTQEVNPKRAEAFMKFVNTLEPKAQKVILGLLGKVSAKAPSLKESVALVILRQVGNAMSLQRMLRTLEERIELESSQAFAPDVVRTLPRIPPNFKNVVHRDAFPTTYHAVVDGLTDTRLVPEALIRVWKDFLIRWGETFTKFEDYHHQHLRELCDRYIEHGNAGQFSDAQVNAHVDGLTAQQLRRLAGEVLVSVEQDLRGVPQDRDLSVAAG